ncbi:Urease accessory protein ureD [Desulfotomaculum nigrificans CO-1-SRB]|uniref:Urease accessory protein UreD n=1 Tax=Desulfotomaculum nigrificans (strain DSM 14880 / VKM B-2319 / CO-1-SRB) TaxID=868595 RepID=F6B8Y3_DESCC|nr:urease accessory protein UreD [Desulfotomaculum nigrificans]AEF93634.1 Urease accessory protein ureD [Desulfotomaculum nigrificans CO-1-SRB]
MLALSNVPGKRGELRLRLGLKEGRTIIKDAYNRVPLKIAKPFYLEPETGEIFLYQMNPTGGMVQGDEYYQEVTLEDGARAYFTTQSAAKIYRMSDSYARQVNVFKVGEGALLEYFPDPVIPFARSRFVGETEIFLHRGATVFLAEIVTPGRVKRDEVFQYEYYHSKTKVYWEGELVLWDNWILTPGSKDIRGLGIYEGYTHYGSLFIFSEQVSQGLADKLHGLFAEADELVGESGNGQGILASASLTLKNGVAVRLLGYRASDLEKAVTTCWDLARRELVGLQKPRIRKY